MCLCTCEYVYIIYSILYIYIHIQVYIHICIFTHTHMDREGYEIPLVFEQIKGGFARKQNSFSEFSIPTAVLKNETCYLCHLPPPPSSCRLMHYHSVIRNIFETCRKQTIYLVFKLCLLAFSVLLHAPPNPALQIALS